MNLPIEYGATMCSPHTHRGVDFDLAKAREHPRWKRRAEIDTRRRFTGGPARSDRREATHV